LGIFVTWTAFIHLRRDLELSTRCTRRHCRVTDFAVYCTLEDQAHPRSFDDSARYTNFHFTCLLIYVSISTVFLTFCRNIFVTVISLENENDYCKLLTKIKNNVRFSWSQTNHETNRSFQPHR